MLDDYSLVILAKKGDQPAQLELFYRYHNYLLKKYNQLKRRNNSSVLFNDFSDFESEAFIYFLAAVKYTNLSKIYDRKRWKFLTPYMYFISNMIADFLSQERLEVLSLNEKVRFNGRVDGTEYIDYIKFNNEEDPIPRQMMEKMECQSFMDTLSIEERTIIEKMNQDSDGKKPTILQLAEQFGISRAWMASKLKGLKEKYRSFSANWF